MHFGSSLEIISCIFYAIHFTSFLIHCIELHVKIQLCLLVTFQNQVVLFLNNLAVRFILPTKVSCSFLLVLLIVITSRDFTSQNHKHETFLFSYSTFYQECFNGE